MGALTVSSPAGYGLGPALPDLIMNKYQITAVVTAVIALICLHGCETLPNGRDIASPPKTSQRQRTSAHLTKRADPPLNRVRKAPQITEAECLASTIYHEARGEPVQGQIAVAGVVIKRTRTPGFRKSICAVVRQPGQFSFVRQGLIPRPKSGDQSWRASIRLANMLMAGQLKSPTPEAIYFHSNSVAPSWAVAATPEAVIGAHSFYSS